MKFSAYVSDIFALLQLAGYVTAFYLLYNPYDWYPVVSSLQE